MSLIKIGSILQYPIIIDDCEREKFFCGADDSLLIENGGCLVPLGECGIIEFQLTPKN